MTKSVLFCFLKGFTMQRDVMKWKWFIFSGTKRSCRTTRRCRKRWKSGKGLEIYYIYSIAKLKHWIFVWYPVSLRNVAFLTSYSDISMVCSNICRSAGFYTMLLAVSNNFRNRSFQISENTPMKKFDGCIKYNSNAHLLQRVTKRYSFPINLK